MITLGARDFAARGFGLRQTPKIPTAREKNLSYPEYQMMGIKLNCTQGKRWGGRTRGARANPFPALFQFSPQFFSSWIFLRRSII